MAMTFDDYKNHYGNNMYNDLNSWYRLSNAGFKKQYKTDMQEKNKALMQAQKAYQEAAPEQKQAALTNLQNAQKAAQSAKKLYEDSLSGTEKDLYKVGQAGKAAGKAFISGVKQQLPGNKNNQQGQQADNTASAQAADTSSIQQTKNNGQQTENNGQQTAEQKGSNIGQKAAKSAGSAIGTAIGTAIGNKWNMQQAGKDPTGTSEANRQIANNHLNMQQATSQTFADRAKQNASRPLGSITGETTKHLTKENFDSSSKQAAADGGAKLMQQENTVMGDINADRDFKTQQAKQAYDWQQEANDEQNVADVLRQDASVMDYNAMQRADYNNQSNALSNATNGQQEVAQTEQQPAQNPSNVQTADEESTGAKDFSFQIPANEVQGVINAVTGHEKGADIRNGGGTPAQQQYYKYLISNGVKVPNVYTPEDKFSKMNDINKQAMDAMKYIRSGGNPTKNYVQGKDGKYYAEGTGEKMNEDQITITNALSGNNAAFGWR